jgi:hypothetical protein
MLQSNNFFMDDEADADSDEEGTGSEDWSVRPHLALSGSWKPV